MKISGVTKLCVYDVKTGEVQMVAESKSPLDSLKTFNEKQELIKKFEEDFGWGNNGKFCDEILKSRAEIYRDRVRNEE